MQPDPAFAGDAREVANRVHAARVDVTGAAHNGHLRAARQGIFVERALQPVQVDRAALIQRDLAQAGSGQTLKLPDPLEANMPALLDRRVVVAYATAAAVFLGLDGLWLTQVAPRVYQPLIGHLMRPDFDALAAAAFYALYVAGIVFFAVRPARDAAGAARLGAALGCIAYATYDLSNQATLRGWPWTATLLDIAWGILATAVASAAARRALAALRL